MGEKEFSAGPFVVSADPTQDPIEICVEYRDAEPLYIAHDEMADLIHCLIRQQTHLRFHPALKDRWHELS